MNQSNDKPNVIVDLWEILLRHRWRFILPAFLVTVTVLTVSLFLPRKYAARAIFERRTDMVLAEISSQHVAQSFQDPRHMLHEDVAGVAAHAKISEKLLRVFALSRAFSVIRRRSHLDDTSRQQKRHVLARPNEQQMAHNP